MNGPVVAQPNPRLVRSNTLLLDTIRARGPIGRTALQSLTGLSRSAVAARVNDLLSAGHIQEVQPAASGQSPRGRPASMLVPARHPGKVVGIDFGHRHVRVAVASSDGLILTEGHASLDVDQQALDALDLAANLVGQALDEAGTDIEEVLAVGAGIPGPISREDNIVTSPTILASWVDLAPVDELRRRLDRPVFVENDATMGALGEWRFGGSQARSDFIYVKASHGIGAGLILNGSLHRGSLGTAGEIGHTVLRNTNGRCRCGRTGCLEASVSTDTVIDQIRHTHLAHLIVDDTAPTMTSVLSRIAADPVGDQILLDAGRAVGQVIADGCSWLNPEAVVVGGELGSAGTGFARGVQESIDHFSQTTIGQSALVEPAHLGLRAEVHGAVATALRHSAAR